MNVKCAKLKTKELLGLHFHSTHIKLSRLRLNPLSQKADKPFGQSLTINENMQLPSASKT